MVNKGETDTSVVDEVIAKDEEWRETVTETDQLRAESNARSKEIGKLMGQGKKEEAQQIIKETGESKEKIKELESRMSELRLERDYLLYKIPNVPDSSVPVGYSEEDNEVYHIWGKPSDR